MKPVLRWTEGMAFKAEIDGNNVNLDAKSPLGKDTGPTPKELVAVGLGGCTAMDVIALLKKHKQMPETFEVEVEVTQSEGPHPKVFSLAKVKYSVTGRVDSAVLIESVRLSQTKFCGVSAMLSKAFPITHEIFLNGIKIGQGEANFSGGEA